MISKTPITVTCEPLPPAQSREEFWLHQAALEWSLADPIIINDAETDVQSRINWQDKVEPYHHQMQNLMTFCRRLPVTLVADDVGLGKTISAGLVLSELMTRRRVSRTLVLCPSILGPQWIEELESKFGIFGRHVRGSALEAEFRGNAPVIVTTYESARSRLEKIQSGQFDMVIMDEAHKIRNLHGTQNPPRLALAIREVLEQRLFKYVLMLTATPIQNRIWDLYSLVDCLAVAKGHVNPLGTPEQFRRRFIADASRGARTLQPARTEEFRTILRQYLVRTRRKDVRLLFPKRQVKTISIAPTQYETKLQGIIASHIEGLSGLLQSSLAQAMMSSPAALVAQLKNMTEKNPQLAGALHQANDEFERGDTPAKLQKLLEIVRELQKERAHDWRLVVFTIRKETQRLIGDYLRQNGVAFGLILGGDPSGNRASIRAFSANPPQINVIVSTDAGAEGVNLQAGNFIVNYDLPWNPMIVEQRIGRIQRLASRHQHVLVANLAVAGGPEETVVARLMHKLQTVAETIGDIEAILEASGADDDQGDNSFEFKIREMVVKSLCGQDVKKAAELAEKSIQEAKQLFENQRETVDATLGRMEQLHATGPTMPKLQHVEPSTSFRDFVRRALKAEGAQIEELDDGDLHCRITGRPAEIITFNESRWREHSERGYFMGKPIKLYLPGKPAFERLVQRWLDRGAHHVVDLRAIAEPLLSRFVTTWLSQINGASLIRFEVLEHTSWFQGAFRCRATASNAVDSYEKLLEVNVSPAGHEAIGEDMWRLGEVECRVAHPNEFDRSVSQRAHQEIEQDSDLGKFRSFYQERFADEVRRAGVNPKLQAKVESDFQPALHGEVVAVEGATYDACRVRVDFSIDGHAGYSEELEIIPATQQQLSDVVWEQCQQTGLRAPVSCLQKCGISNRTVLRHLLVKSALSGRSALAEHVFNCPGSEEVVLVDETGASDVSGVRTRADLLIASPVSGKRALEGEMVCCTFTSDLVLPDELRTSEASGKLYRIDQEGISEVSGRRGHRSEFVVCAYTADLILPSESVVSELSGHPIRSDVAQRSDLPPHRIGAPDEFVKCSMTGKCLLKDEIGVCEITGESVSNNYLMCSDFSGRKARTDLTITCDVTGKRLLPDEFAVSAVSGRRYLTSLGKASDLSGRPALPDELKQCAFTHVDVLPDELRVSDFSGKAYRTDQESVSAESGRRGHASEFIRCAFTGDSVLPDESVVSGLSRRPIRSSIAQQSEKPPYRAGAPNEFAKCAVTGLRLLSDEVAQCGVSGDWVSIDHLVSSDVSGRLAKFNLVVTCKATGKRLMPDESIVSAASGKRFCKSLAVSSAVSGQPALREELKPCEITGANVLPDELATSEVSHRRFRRDQIVISDATGRKGHVSEQATCEFTGQTILKDEIAISVVSGKKTARAYMVASEGSGRFGYRGEAARCEESGALLLMDELAPSAVSGARVDARLLAPSALSGRRALLREMVQCQESGKVFLPEEAAVCSVSGKTVDPRLVVRSDASGRLMLGRLAVVSPLSHRRCCPNEAQYCHWTEQHVLPDEVITCRRTNLTFVRSLIDERGEFSVLNQLLSGRLQLRDLSTLVPKLRGQANGKLRAAKRAWGVVGPTGRVLAARVELHGFFSIEIRNVGLLIRFDGTDWNVLGSIV